MQHKPITFYSNLLRVENRYFVDGFDAASSSNIIISSDHKSIAIEAKGNNPPHRHLLAIQGRIVATRHYQFIDLVDLQLVSATTVDVTRGESKGICDIVEMNGKAIICSNLEPRFMAEVDI